MISCITGKRVANKKCQDSVMPTSESKEDYKTVNSDSDMPKQSSINFQDILEHDETYNISHYTSSDSGNYSIIQNISVFL